MKFFRKLFSNPKVGDIITGYIDYNAIVTGMLLKKQYSPEMGEWYVIAEILLSGEFERIIEIPRNGIRKLKIK